MSGPRTCGSTSTALKTRQDKTRQCYRGSLIPAFTHIDAAADQSIQGTKAITRKGAKRTNDSVGGRQ